MNPAWFVFIFNKSPSTEVSGMLWYALLSCEERATIASQTGLCVVTEPTVLQVPGCKGFWLHAKQALFVFQHPLAQLTDVQE